MGNLKNPGVITPVKLNHTKEQVSIYFAGISDIKVIQIFYGGRMAAVSNLPDGWLLQASDRKIICVNFGEFTPESIFTYIGRIDIISASYITSTLEVIPLPISVSGIDKWEIGSQTFDKEEGAFSDYDNEHTFVKDIRRTSIIKYNLVAEQGEFAYEDGVDYSGDYHLFHDGQAVTGKRFEPDSKLIYRKSKSGKLLKRKNIIPANYMQSRGSEESIRNALYESDMTGDTNIVKEYVQVRKGTDKINIDDTAYSGGGSE